MADERNLPSGVVNTLRELGAWFINTLWKLGFASRFLAAVVMQSGQLFLRPQLLIREIFFAGVLSLIIIVVSGLFVGMVLGLQGYNTLVRFGSADALGTLVALSLLRELGPVLAALLFASRSGSAMTAEIGLMKATEQLDAMAVMGVNPLARVVAPRFWAGLFSLPILTALFNVMGIIGGYYVGVVMIGLDEGSYWAQMQNAVDLHDDVINGLIKSLFFGVAVTLIAVFEGYDAEATAAGVSAATTRTVVTSALVILAMDFVLTAFMF
ncbi:MAG: lipid asymmetry maintenance ABC transporter permease subunit MlaE [Cellvibrionales bacterium]|jgi:phospholipid/cholesterol/gamma-HCH transport system permease protein|nr:lipid asymmetry maintenance ABC transporter permease subunit MlaE [Cellvibrionales bacterium]MBK8676029.1 lipid asymmetry maintenance ABC transporter permease subunit MlaE [Cellvibrionales bacterium]